MYEIMEDKKSLQEWKTNFETIKTSLNQEKESDTLKQFYPKIED